jgi:myosin-crossreactive antigen
MGKVEYKETEEDKKWRVESDLRTIKEAMEIVQDKSRFSDVQKEIANQQELLSSLSKVDGKYLEEIGFKKK